MLCTDIAKRIADMKAQADEWDWHSFAWKASACFT